MSLSPSFKCVAVLLPLLAISHRAEAGPIDISLFTQPYQEQVAGWLGTSATFTSIYSQFEGNSIAWHAAVDGQGPTVTLIQTSLGLIGGYNPYSWFSSGDYNYTESASDRTAFIFNLSTSLMLPQASSPEGEHQTYNWSGYGPTFGGGHDIYVDGALSGGYAYPWSYVSGSNTNLFGASWTDFTVSKIETFAVSPSSAVPEPSTWLLLASSVGALILSRRKRKQT